MSVGNVSLPVTCSVLMFWASWHWHPRRGTSGPVIQGFHHFFPFLPIFDCHRIRLSVSIINCTFRISDPEHAMNFELTRLW